MKKTLTEREKMVLDYVKQNQCLTKDIANNAIKRNGGIKMNVFEMEKELNDLIKHGQELIQKLKNNTFIGKLGWVSDVSPDEKVRCLILERFEPESQYPYVCNECAWIYFTPLTAEEIEQYTGYKVEESK